MKKALIILLSASAATAASGAGVPKQVQQVISMTPADFANRVDVIDDGLEKIAVITTRPGFQETGGLLKVVQPGDGFLRAFVDKKTGAATFQLYQNISYVSTGYRRYIQLNFELPSGVETADVVAIGSNIDCSYGGRSGCFHTEIVSSDIAEASLRAVAATYKPVTLIAWKYRFKAQSGDNFDGWMVPAEVAGVLLAVENYRATKGLPTPTR